MYPSIRFARSAAVVLVAFWLAGCATLSVNSYTQRGVDMKQYRTYSWEASAPEATGDPRLDSNPFFDERVRADVEKQLARRGFEKTWESPDLLLHYHASMTQRIDVNGIDREHGYCEAGDCRPFVYDAGTLLLDMVDAHTHKIVWRGWVEGSMDGVIDSQRLMESRIDESVARLFQKMPPRS